MEDGVKEKFYEIQVLSAIGSYNESEGEASGEGAWVKVNSLLEKIVAEGEPEQRFELAMMLVNMPPDDDEVMEYINQWTRINGWELLVDQEQVSRLARFFKTDHGGPIANLLRQNVDGFNSKASGVVLPGKPEKYLAFVSACTALQFSTEPNGSEPRKLFDMVIDKLEDKKFRACMEEICSWEESARPVAVMKKYL